MNSQPVPLPAPSGSARRAATLPALGQLTLAEVRRLTRNPMFAVGTIGFPVLWFSLFGLPNLGQKLPDGSSLGPYMLVNFGAAALLTLAFFSFGVNVAVERTGGWLKLLRASPMRAPLYFTAKVLAAMLFAAVSLSLLYAFGHFVGGVTLGLGTALAVLGKLLLGMIPVVALGLAIGFLVNPTAANVIANIVSIVMSFASGLFMPLSMLPGFMRKLAPYLPAYHLGEVGRSPLAAPSGGESGHWLILAGFTVLFGLLAAWGFRKDEAREA